MDSIEIGAAYRFVPAAFGSEKSGLLPGREVVQRVITGRICEINRAHHYFRVEYEINGCQLHECFKF
jgi:hypothetical protein